MSVFDPENVKQSEGFVHPKHLFVSGGVAQEITNETTNQSPYTFARFHLLFASLKEKTRPQITIYVSLFLTGLRVV